MEICLGLLVLLVATTGFLIYLGHNQILQELRDIARESSTKEALLENRIESIDKRLAEITASQKLLVSGNSQIEDNQRDIASTILVQSKVNSEIHNEIAEIRDELTSFSGRILGPNDKLPAKKSPTKKTK